MISPRGKRSILFLKGPKIRGYGKICQHKLLEFQEKNLDVTRCPLMGLSIPKVLKLSIPAMPEALTGEKKIKGRKRHIVVDTSGRILGAEVHQANMHDTKSGILALRVAKDFFPTITACCGDAGYRGTFEREAATELGVEVDIVARNQEDGWKILPKRWVVERTFSWFCNYRRLSKDYEVLSSTEVAFIYLTNIHILLKRLDKNI